MEIVRLSPNIGANIAGIDLSKPLALVLLKISRLCGTSTSSYDLETSQSEMMTSSDSVNILANLIRQAQIHTGLHSYRNTPRLM